jgi:hypothetical protein
MIYLFPEHPTYIPAGAHVQAECKPVGDSGRSQVLALLWTASGLVHLFLRQIYDNPDDGDRDGLRKVGEF